MRSCLLSTFRVTALALILTLPSAGEVFASSCCAGGGGQSICLLPSEQRYQFGLANTYRSIGGEFDPYGNYTSYPAGTSNSQVITVAGAAYRLNDDWQLGLSVPFTTNQQTVSGKSRSATTLGDPAIEGRYLLWEDLAFLPFQPQLSLYEGVRFPVGTSVYSSTDPYSLDAVGDGTPTVHSGFNVSKLYRPVKLTLDGTFFYPFSRSVDRMRGQTVASPYRLKLGNRYQLAESVGYLFNESWSLTAGLRQLWVEQTKIDGVRSEGSAQRLFSSLASLNYFYNSSWGVGLTYETAYPFYRYQANQPYAQSASLALTYGGI